MGQRGGSGSIANPWRPKMGPLAVDGWPGAYPRAGARWIFAGHDRAPCRLIAVADPESAAVRAALTSRAALTFRAALTSTGGPLPRYGNSPHGGSSRARAAFARSRHQSLWPGCPAR